MLIGDSKKQGSSPPRSECPTLGTTSSSIGISPRKFVSENLSKQHVISRRYFWSDSETVMKWLYSDNRKYTQYVGCRIGEILETCKVHEWNWIAGNRNVADMVTKMRTLSLESHSEWFHGHHKDYPVRKLDAKDTNEELRPHYREHHINHHEETEYRVEKWIKLRRIFAFVSGSLKS